MSGTGIDVPNLPKCLVPVYRSVRYPYWCTEPTEVSGTGKYWRYASVRTGPNTPLHTVQKVPFGSTGKKWKIKTRSLLELEKRQIICISILMSQCGGTGLMYRTYQSVRYRFYVVPNIPRCPVPVSMLYRYRYQLLYRRAYRYRYWCTELTLVSRTGIDVPNFYRVSGPGVDVPNLPKCPVAVLMYRTCRSVRYRCWCCTELTEVSGTGIDVVPNLPKCPVPVLMSYRSYRSVRYRYWCTELTEVSGTGNNTGGKPRNVPYRTHRSLIFAKMDNYRYENCGH